MDRSFWRVWDEFPRYRIDAKGNVTDVHGRPLRPDRNGTVRVYKGGKVYRRSPSKAARRIFPNGERTVQIKGRLV